MSEKYLWWNALVHGGCLIAPARLEQHIEDEPIPWEYWRLERVRRAQERFINRRDTGSWVETVLEEALGHRLEEWPSPSGPEWTVKGVTGENLRPRRIFDPEGQPFPLFISDNERVGVGKGRRDIARAVEWLRKKDLELALVTNGRQWRIVYAGETADAWAESSIDNWFAEGYTAPALEALRHLLNPAALKGPLRQAVIDTRKGQSELSAALGEQVRQAVEHLIVASRDECDKALESGTVTLSDLYAAGVRMIMRMVVLMFAESRELLPMTEAAYFRSYSIRYLYENLELQGHGQGGAERLRTISAAWPRIIALCRLVHEGSPHPRLPVPEYGGELFLPGDPSGTGLPRAVAALESTLRGPNDRDIQRILTLITQAPIKIRQGRGAMITMFPVDFSQLDSEFIGIIYEGLLDYELRRAAEDQPQIILAIGDQPILPLRRLEGMSDAQLKDLLDKMKVKAATAEEGEAEEEEEEEEAEEEPEATGEVIPAPPADISNRYEVREAANAWAKRAVLAARLLKRNATEKEVEAKASELITDVRAPGEYYLVRFGGTRKGSGTFYTVPALAGPTVRRTLEPMLFDGNGPREPDQILALKVCDPACGSGSFPLAALRQINEALYDSLIAHGWLKDDEGIIRPLNPPHPTPEWLKDVIADMPGVNEPVGPIGHDERIKARLKRHVVERCLYGVDINRLAVELTRVALWIETMDPRLPFSFLDHKFKVGNALVGCWFDRFQDYPLLAWQREGGDKTHPTSVHHVAGTWTKAIKDSLEPIKRDLVNVITGQLDVFGQTVNAEGVHDQALGTYQELHSDPSNPEAQKRRYEQLRRTTGFQRLEAALNAWCAVWFWPADRLQDMPTASRLAHALNWVGVSLEGAGGFGSPQELWRLNEQVDSLAKRHLFFHWELEFPDVFAGTDPGFDAVVGNPPWEIQKPNSKEWFSNLDPLYRSYGKQVALAKQKELFEDDSETEIRWLTYNADLKSASNWVRSAGDPYNDTVGVSLTRSRDENKSIFRAWEAKRKHRRGHAPLPHPFVSQGSADINTYKLFLEQSLSICRSEGRIGLIVPSGVYTDRGSVDLRDRILNECRWEWLFGFENRDKIFDIDSRFKFCPVIVRKGGETQSVRTAFMRRDLADWAAAQPETLLVTREQIRRFSPRSRALLEVRDTRDIEILETMTANGIPLGDDSVDGWGVQYAREFDMTNDSKLFPPREQWERQGYQPDEYGHWLKGNWRKLATAPSDEGQEVEGDRLMVDRRSYSVETLIRSRCGRQRINLEDIEDVALPLYQGLMIHQFVANRATFDIDSRRWAMAPRMVADLSPQYLMALHSARSRINEECGPRVSFRGIARTTDERTTITCITPGFPSSNMLPNLRLPSSVYALSLSACLNSFCFDWSERIRQPSAALLWHTLSEQRLPRPLRMRVLAAPARQLSCTCVWWAPIWTDYDSPGIPWRHLWVVTDFERLRLRCALDAAVAQLYDLSQSQFAYVLLDCDYPVEQVTNKAFARNLDPKGFWRVDKYLDPELRHTVLAQVAFADLKALIRTHGEEEGLQRFLGTGPDDGWMLPETLCLADYGLGHDERAKRPQPVASRLGPRFYDWQLQQSPEESWSECRHHAANIRAIRAIGLPEPEINGTSSTEGEPHSGVKGTSTTNPPHSVKKPITASLFDPSQDALFNVLEQPGEK